METIVSAISNENGDTAPRRVDDSAPASTQREATRPAEADVKKAKAPEAREVQRAAERLSEALQKFNGDLSISVNQDTGSMVVKVTGPNGDVVRQMPPEQLLEAQVNIDKIIGLFVNDTV
jgi:uncharacterized FlaG/YvyC family protein